MITTEDLERDKKIASAAEALGKITTEFYGRYSGWNYGNYDYSFEGCFLFGDSFHLNVNGLIRSEMAAHIAHFNPSKVKELLAEIERLRTALGFYAKPTTYSVDEYKGLCGEMISRVVLYGDSTEKNDIYSYAGRRARQALGEE